MRIYYQLPRIFNFIAAMIMLLIMCADAHAVSFIADKGGHVIIKDGRPCFYGDGKDGSAYLLYSEAEILESGKYTSSIFWHFQVSSGEVPNKKTNCLKYGVLPAGKVTVTEEAKPLLNNTPYLVLLYTEELRYVILFCILKEKNGNSTVVETVDGRYPQCSNKPIVEKD